MHGGTVMKTVTVVIWLVISKVYQEINYSVRMSRCAFP